MGDRNTIMYRFAGVLLCLCAFAQDASKPVMTARELFYSAATTAPAVKPPTATPKAPQKVMVASRPKPATPQVGAPNPGPDKVPGSAHFITVAAGMPTSAPPPEQGTPLGLKYTLLRLSGDHMLEVATDTVFRAGDRIQFRVETNGPGYLYIISQGSSGQWQPMFPSPDLDGGSNRVEGFHTYTMPLKTRFYFDEQPGTEKVFLVLTREKEADLENMIYSLRDRTGGGGTRATPVTAPAPEASPSLIRASINDAEIGRLRLSYSRDLIVEAVEPTTPGAEKKESAIYVVNPTGKSDSKLVADLLLVHK